MKNVITVKLTQSVMAVQNVHNARQDLRYEYLLTIDKLTRFFFRVAADSARSGRTLLHARRGAGRAADSVRVSRAAINDL